MKLKFHPPLDLHLKGRFYATKERQMETQIEEATKRLQSALWSSEKENDSSTENTFEQRDGVGVMD